MLIRLVPLWLCLGLAQIPDLHGPAGTYTVTSPGPVTITHGEDYVVFSWASPDPTPGPDPGPQPGPTPPPGPNPPPVPPVVDGPLYVSLVMAANPTQEEVAVQGDLLVVDWKSRQANFRAYVNGQEEPDRLGLQRVVSGVLLPAVVVQARDASGKWPVAKVLAHVTSRDEVLNAITSLRGAR